MEKSLVLIKPDAVSEKRVGDIIKIYEDNNLNILELKMIRVTEEIAKKHYEEHINKSFFKELLDFIMSGPICAMILEGEECIKKIREINGNTNPKKAEIGTIRNLYGTDIQKNCVHASDSKESAKREIEIWF